MPTFAVRFCRLDSTLPHPPPLYLLLCAGNGVGVGVGRWPARVWTPTVGTRRPRPVGAGPPGARRCDRQAGRTGFGRIHIALNTKRSARPGAQLLYLIGGRRCAEGQARQCTVDQQFCSGLHTPLGSCIDE
eukprot:gene9424-biopygen2824